MWNRCRSCAENGRHGASGGPLGRMGTEPGCRSENRVLGSAAVQVLRPHYTLVSSYLHVISSSAQGRCFTYNAQQSGVRAEKMDRETSIHIWGFA